MTFCEARVQVGFPDYLLVDMGIFDLVAWFKAIRERLGDHRRHRVLYSQLKSRYR